MRIAYLISQYPTIPHIYICREVLTLRRMGWDVQTISVQPPDRPPDKLTPVEYAEWKSTYYILNGGVGKGVTAHLRTALTRPAGYLRGICTALAFGNFAPVKTLKSLAYFTEALIAGNWLQAHGYRHLHSHYSSTVALYLTRVFDVRMSMTIHGSGEFVDTKGFWLGPKVAAASFVVAISYYGRSQLMLASAFEHWHKFEIVPLGVDLSVYTPAPFHEQSNPFEIISVGSLRNVKGFPILIDAVAKLAREGREIVLRIVGDGPERDRLQRHATDLGIAAHVIFDGWKTQDEVRELYRAAHICALASFAEGVPVTLMEAMASGVPCVASRITGIPELIRDGKDGLLVTPSSVCEFAAAIARLMDDAALRRSLGCSARRRIEENYDLNRNMARLSEVFRCRMGSSSDS